MSKIVEVPIVGRVRSCYNEKWGTPRQGKYSSSSLATIELNSKIFCLNELRTLEGYSHAILIFVFSLNKIKNSQKSFPHISNKDIYGFLQNAKVTPPKIDNGEKRGCLATRSPHRPVPIGLTICSIAQIDLLCMKIQIMGVDMVDGTPIIEILPYSPSYLISRQIICVPNWVDPEKNKGMLNLCVYFSFAAYLDVLTISNIKGEHSSIRFFEADSLRNFNKLHDFISETLKIDPRSRYSKKNVNHKLFGIKLFNSFQLIYQYHGGCIKVIRFLHMDNLIVRGLSPRTINWCSRLKSFISLDN